jgi:hypothetical protein
MTDRVRTRSPVVHHFGPDPATVGGMATVIRLLTEHQVGGRRRRRSPDMDAAVAPGERRVGCRVRVGMAV